MTNEEFGLRLSKLRIQNGVSARDMSLSIGQNPGYINSIECGKSLPSMTCFFYICDYLHITPQEFFDVEIQQPQRLNHLLKCEKRLTPKQLDNIDFLVEELSSKNNNSL